MGKMKRILYILLIASMPSLLIGQKDSLILNMKVSYQGKELRLDDSTSYYYEGKPIYFSGLRYYLSASFCSDTFDYDPIESGSYRLIDLAEEASLSFKIDRPTKNNRLRLILGVDSLTTSKGILEGDLDPTLGMYWTWQSGYINVKLEGSSPLIPGKRKEFQFHLGGYRSPFVAAQTFFPPLAPETSIAVVELELAEFMRVVQFQQMYRIMSPSMKAVQLSQLLAQSIRVYVP